MRILIFSTAYLPLVGGAELAVKEITDRIHDASFVLITARFRPTLPRRERMGNVEVHRVGLGFWFDKWLVPFWGLRLAISLHKKEPFGAVWGIMASYGGLAASWFKRLFKEAPFILTLQEGDSLSHIYKRARFFLPLFRRIFTRADRVTAISRFLAEWAQHMKVRAPIYIVPNGVNAEAFSVKRVAFSEGGEIRKKLGFSADDKIIITTSRLVEKNGVGDLIESLAHFPPSVKLLICGSGPLERSLKFKVESLKLGKRVLFAGYIPHEELPDYLHASDIFCRPSHSEGLGNSFLEAMAAGLPVVATPVGGIPDFLTPPPPHFSAAKKVFSNSATFGQNLDAWHARVTGLFCEVGNPKSIAEQIQLLLSDETLREMIIHNASTMVREKYEWGGIAKRMDEVFQKIS